VVRQNLKILAGRDEYTSAMQPHCKGKNQKTAFAKRLQVQNFNSRISIVQCSRTQDKKHYTQQGVLQ